MNPDAAYSIQWLQIACSFLEKGKFMYNFDQAAGQVIAADTQSSVAAIDEAVLSYARLCCSIVEVSGSSDLPVVAAQKALKSTVSGLNALIASREEIATATRELVKIQKISTLEAVSFGCPGGLPEKTATADIQVLASI